MTVRDGLADLVGKIRESITVRRVVKAAAFQVTMVHEGRTG